MDTIPKVKRAVDTPKAELRQSMSEIFQIQHDIARMQASLTEQRYKLVKLLIDTGNIQCLTVNERRVMRAIDNM